MLSPVQPKPCLHSLSAPACSHPHPAPPCPGRKCQTSGLFKALVISSWDLSLIPYGLSSTELLGTSSQTWCSSAQEHSKAPCCLELRPSGSKRIPWELKVPALPGLDPFHMAPDLLTHQSQQQGESGRPFLTSLLKITALPTTATLRPTQHSLSSSPQQCSSPTSYRLASHASLTRLLSPLHVARDFTLGFLVFFSPAVTTATQNRF